MRWSIVRVIWFRELRDQLRDRRTIFMIAVLPILLYPLVGMGVIQLFAGFIGKPNVVGILGADNLPKPGRSTPTELFVLPMLPAQADPLGGIPGGLGACAVSLSSVPHDYPPLLVSEAGKTTIPPSY